MNVPDTILTKVKVTLFTSLLFLCLKKACTLVSYMYKSQLYLMLKIWEIVSVLMLALAGFD
jgi:hypothetical protein